MSVGLCAIFMFEVEVQKQRNLLKLSFYGKVTPAETTRSLEQLHAVVPEMKPGFYQLTDLRELEDMDPACASDIEKTMDLANKHGVSTIIRIIPHPQKDIGLNIMSLFHYSRGVRIITCKRMEEALKLLPPTTVEQIP
jgi:hypothetical protein